jgi:hypothetical protein
MRLASKPLLEPVTPPDLLRVTRMRAELPFHRELTFQAGQTRIVTPPLAHYDTSDCSLFTEALEAFIY